MWWLIVAGALGADMKCWAGNARYIIAFTTAQQAAAEEIKQAAAELRAPESGMDLPHITVFVESGMGIESVDTRDVLLVVQDGVGREILRRTWDEYRSPRLRMRTEPGATW